MLEFLYLVASFWRPTEKCILSNYSKHFKKYVPINDPVLYEA